MADPRALVEAGALVPAGIALPEDLPVDTVDARGYRHPGIPDRVVVRLVPDAVAAGVDTEMAILGFALATARTTSRSSAAGPSASPATRS